RNVRVRHVFSWEFVVMLVDVILVGIYFSLSRGAEIPKPNEAVKPSSVNEAIAVGLIFILYFIWDFLTKAVIPEEGATSTFRDRLTKGRMKQRGWISLVCMMLGILAWWLLRFESNYWKVIMADVS